MVTQILNNVIWYTYKGDEICWDGNKYISLVSTGSFSSLDEIDKFWENYKRDCNSKGIKTGFGDV